MFSTEVAASVSMAGSVFGVTDKLVVVSRLVLPIFDAGVGRNSSRTRARPPASSHFSQREASTRAFLPRASKPLSHSSAAAEPRERTDSNSVLTCSMCSGQYILEGFSRVEKSLLRCKVAGEMMCRSLVRKAAGSAGCRADGTDDRIRSSS